MAKASDQVDLAAAVTQLVACVETMDKIIGAYLRAQCRKCERRMDTDTEIAAIEWRHRQNPTQHALKFARAALEAWNNNVKAERLPAPAPEGGEHGGE